MVGTIIRVVLKIKLISTRIVSPDGPQIEVWKNKQYRFYIRNTQQCSLSLSLIFQGYNYFVFVVVVVFFPRGLDVKRYCTSLITLVNKNNNNKKNRSFSLSRLKRRRKNNNN